MSLPGPASIHTADGSRTATRSPAALVEAALGRLGSVGHDLGVVLAEPDAESERLHRLGFHFVTACQDGLDESRIRADTCIIVTTVSDVSSAESILCRLNQLEGCAVIITVMISPVDLTDETPEGLVQLGKSMASSRNRLLELGANDVIGLRAGEPLMPYRVMEVAERSVFVAQKASQLIASEVAAVREQMERKLEATYKKFFTKLPGNVLLGTLLQETTPCEEFKDGKLVQIQDYSVTAKLGTGSYGTVMQAAHPVRGVCAVKMVAKTSVKSTQMFYSLDRELSILKKLRPHPNIVKAYEVLHSPTAIYIAMSYAGSLNLHKYCTAVLEDTGKGLPAELVRSIATQQAQAVAHIHSSLICHLDLKPDNWIVSDEGESVLLTDFGLARMLVNQEQPLTDCSGSLPFCAPEVYERGFSTSGNGGRAGAAYSGLRADIWSLAVGFIELATSPYSIERLLGWEPRKPKDGVKVLADIKSLETAWRTRADIDVFQGFSDIVAACLLVDPKSRCSVWQVLGPEGLGA